MRKFSNRRRNGPEKPIREADIAADHRYLYAMERNGAEQESKRRLQALLILSLHLSF
jgi:hypothetical protein